MYLEGVTVSVGYGDFLRHTLDHNRHHFDDFVVVTSKDDEETMQVCADFDVTCHPTNEFFELDGKTTPFTKGRGVNAGLACLERGRWTVHLDADIVLPPDFRFIVDRLEQQGVMKEYRIYGADRLMCPSYDAWMRCSTADLRDKFSAKLDMFPVGHRLIHNPKLEVAHDGYVPIGYFQMWHRKSSQEIWYLDEHTKTERSDSAFARQWVRWQRHLLAEFAVIHLESEPSPIGTNWWGRKTKRFGPNIVVKTIDKTERPVG